jgi:hypothetical protein
MTVFIEQGLEKEESTICLCCKDDYEELAQECFLQVFARIVEIHTLTKSLLINVLTDKCAAGLNATGQNTGQGFLILLDG